MEIMWKWQKVTRPCAEDAKSDGYSCNETDATDSCFQSKGKDEVGKV